MQNVTNIHVVILAAGKGTRMKSQLPKVLHKISGLSLIRRVIRTATALRPSTTTVVVGHGGDQVREALSDAGVDFVVQEQQLGTGHALLQTRSILEGQSGTIVLLSGDVPLLSAESLRALLEAHTTAAAAATVMTWFLALAINRWVELPTQKLGKRAADALKEKPATDNLARQ